MDARPPAPPCGAQRRFARRRGLPRFDVNTILGNEGARANAFARGASRRSRATWESENGDFHTKPLIDTLKIRDLQMSTHEVHPSQSHGLPYAFDVGHGRLSTPNRLERNDGKSVRKADGSR